jgi:transcription-repair coupling factor (superfamily II helicase)
MRSFGRRQDGDLKALDAGTMPAAMDKYLALRYEKPATIFEYFDAPIVFLNEPSAVREAAKGVEFRFGEAFKGLLEEGVRAPGRTVSTRTPRICCTRREKRHAVVCENFARTIPDLKLADTVNAQTHSLPPWGGEVSAWPTTCVRSRHKSMPWQCWRARSARRRACAGPCRRGLFRPSVS